MNPDLSNQVVSTAVLIGKALYSQACLKKVSEISSVHEVPNKIIFKMVRISDMRTLLRKYGWRWIVHGL